MLADGKSNIIKPLCVANMATWHKASIIPHKTLENVSHYLTFQMQKLSLRDVKLSG